MSGNGIYASMDQRDYQTRYRLFDTTLAHPVEKVWPFVLDIESWMTDQRLETISGQPGEVGHFARVWPPDIGDDVPEPHYHLYGVAEIIPHKLVALEVLREKGGSYGDTAPRITFDSLILSGSGDLTHLTLLGIALVLEPAGQVPVPPTVSEEVIRDRVYRYFENLENLVAKA